PPAEFDDGQADAGDCQAGADLEPPAELLAVADHQADSPLTRRRRVPDQAPTLANNSGKHPLRYPTRTRSPPRRRTSNRSRRAAPASVGKPSPPSGPGAVRPPSRSGAQSTPTRSKSPAVTKLACTSPPPSTSTLRTPRPKR